MLAVLAPGQGAQKPGFLSPWLSDWEGAGAALARLRWFSALTGLDLVHLGTEADAEEIKDTARTQPLLVAAGLIAAQGLPMDDVAVVAGHSVGELTAAALSGALTPETAVALAGLRGREMAAACALEETGMSAVLGGDGGPDAVVARLEEYGLTAANRNGAGQIVAAGPLSDLQRLKAEPPAGAKVIPLQVAGAFHTKYMAPAEQAFQAVAAGVRAADPERLLLSNADGTAVGTGAETVTRLVRQLTSPVRWDLCQQSLADLGITAVIELAPAGTLAGLAKRALSGVEIVKVNTPADLRAARELAEQHAGAPDIEPAVHFHVAVSPSAGSFEPADLVEGDTIARGSAVGHVITRQGSIEVTAAHPGVLVEWLADAADPVAPGQPLARLHPVGERAFGERVADDQTAGAGA